MAQPVYGARNCSGAGSDAVAATILEQVGVEALGLPIPANRAGSTPGARNKRRATSARARLQASVTAGVVVTMRRQVASDRPARRRQAHETGIAIKVNLPARVADTAVSAGRSRLSWIDSWASTAASMYHSLLRGVGGGVQRLEVTGKMAQGLTWTGIDVVLERGNYRLLWFVTPGR